LLAKDDRPFTGVVVGDGPERSRLETLRNELGLDKVVHFIGAVAGASRLYGELDLLVIPSRSEGLPNVLLEALQADVPVVATAVGAIPEVMQETCAGIIVPPESPQHLATAIVSGAMLRAQHDSREARRAIVERFSLEARARAHIALYEELVGLTRGDVPR
jgi:glycosyltransferase involved in cell wall biosynthesis